MARTARPSAPAPSTRTRAVAYLRVSTDKQADKGVSLDAQRAKVEAYAALFELDLVAVIVDAGESAKSLDRPGLARALGMLDSREADALFVVKLDRLTRSVRDLGALVERYFAKGAALLSVGEQIDTRSAAGRLVLNVLASVSQWEREAIGERTATAMAYKAGEGEFTGGRVPFGYRLAADGVRLEAHGDEQAIIGAARELAASGLSLRSIAARLEERGFVSRSGRPFAAVQIARMLERGRGVTGPGRVVDLARARRALAELDRIAREHPELVDHTRASAADWEADLPDLLQPEDPETMAAQQIQQSFRFSADLFERIDRYAEALSKATGLEVSRSDAVRSLVVRALDAIDAEGGNVLPALKPTTKPRKGGK